MEGIDPPSTVDSLGCIGIAERGAHLTHGIAQIHLRGPYKGTTAMNVSGKIAEGAFGVVKLAYLSIPNVPRLVEVAVKTVKGAFSAFFLKVKMNQKWTGCMHLHRLIN